MKLRMKIMSGFLILVIMLAVAGFFSIYELLSISSSVQSLLDENYKSIVAVKKMIEALEREDSGLLLFLSGERIEGRQMIEKADTVFLSALQTAKNSCTLLNEQNIVEDIGLKYETYKDLWADSIAGGHGNYDRNWYFEHSHAAFQAVKTSADNLMALNETTIYQTASNLKNRMHRIIMPGIIAIVSALVFALLFNYFINRYFVNPIISITNEVQKILRTGNPSSIEIETDDELKKLASAINDLSSQVRK
jgi:methyl-accepting chemotaxis protein